MIYNSYILPKGYFVLMHDKITNAGKKIEKFLRDFFGGDFFGLSAEMSFYLLSCFLPMIILVFTVASAISQNYTDAVFVALGALPDKVAKLLIKMLVSRSRSTVVIAITGGFSLFTLSGFILTLKKGLDRFCKTKSDRGFIKLHITALIFAFFIYISIIASFSLIIFGKVIATHLFKIPSISSMLPLWNTSRYVLILIFISFVISALFKSLPAIRLRIRDVLPGAAFTTLAWYCASVLFALYVNNFPQYEIIYGSLAGFACMIMWIYITCMAMIAGAKINAMIYNHRLEKSNTENAGS